MAAFGRSTRGEELVGVRPFHYEDDPRAISLKLSVRYDEPTIVETVPEWKACVVFLVDVSRSMAPIMEKVGQFLRLVVDCLRFEDPPLVGWFLFADVLLERSPGFTANPPELRSFLMGLAHGKSDADLTLRALRRVLGVPYRGALIVMISDFIMPLASPSLLRAFRREYDFLPLIVRSAASYEALPKLWGGAVMVEDVESGGAEFTVDRLLIPPPADVHFRAHGISPLVLENSDTSDEWMRDLIRFFDKREHRVGRLVI